MSQPGTKQTIRSFPDPYRRYASFFGAAAAALGLLCLSGWILEMPLLASLRSSYIPMAPFTAIAFICLGGLLFVHTMRATQGPVGILAVVLSSLLSAYGLIELVEGRGTPVLSMEERFFPNTQWLGAIPTGRMSPATAALLFISGAVVPMLFLRWRGGKRQKLFGDLAGCLGVLVTMVGTVFVLSYLHGAPILYGTTTIPMAATTAIAFLLLGTGQVLAAGPDSFPSRLFAGPSTRARLRRAFVSTTIGVVVAIDLLHVYAHQVFFDNNAFMSGFSTTVFLVIAGMVIARVALKVGDDMDRSEGVRKRTEEAMSELEKQSAENAEYYQRIIGSSSLGIATYDAVSGFGVSANHAFAKIIGATVEEAVGQNFRHIESWKKSGLLETAEYVLSNGGECERDYHLVTTFGQEIWIHCQLIRFSIRGKTHLLFMIADITERKRSEKALRESEEKFRVIFEGSKDGIILADVESRKFYTANKTFCEMLQYSLDEIRQLCVSDIHPEEDLPRLLDAFERGAKQESSLEGDVPVRRKDGSVLWIEVTASPVTISGKKYLLGNYRDVTERRKADEALTRLGLAVDQAADAIVITDTEGTIQYVNPAFERSTGYSREEAVGMNPRVLRSGKQEESFYRELWETLTRGEVWAGHFINRRKDGSLYEEDAKISPLRNSSGKIVNYVASKRDVTQMLLLEKQVRTAQKMEAVGTLAGGIAHDFNNALTGIVGFGELLRMRMAGDEQALLDLGEILRSAERAAKLTRQLLTFARRQVIEPVNLNLSPLVEDLMKFVGKVVGEHIELKTSLGKDVPAIHADPGQIEQVVMNLCLNARDAMPEGGRLAVETEDVYLEEEYVRQKPYMKPGRYALLTVSDTGIGMDEKTRERVFEPFFTTKGLDKGTGLGLAMVYGIVKQHSGFIHLYSEPGKGTVLKVYFPAVEAQPDAVTVKGREEIVRGGTETILLAEDEGPIRALAGRILAGLGYTVLAARNGEEAVEMFRQNKEIALAVLDVVMPRKGGKEAFEEMRKQNPRLKAIFMSGYNVNGIHDSFVLTAGMPFLQKPFGPTTLAKKIREVLDKPLFGGY